jgi:hypothetical protein
LRFQLSPTAVEHGFCHPCFDELLAADIAYDNCLVSVNDPPRELMQCVMAPTQGPAMQSFRLPFVRSALRPGYFGFETTIKLS